MRYRAEIENGKIKHYRNKYFLLDENNQRYIVNKTWVRRNIDLISNASVSNEHVYIIKDQLEKAKQIIIRDMIKQTKSIQGFGLTNELNIMNYDIQHNTLNKIPSRPFASEAWRFIGHYNIETSKIFQDCLIAAIEQLKSQGNQVWQTVDSDGNRWLFANKGLAEEFATKSNSIIMEL